MNCRRCGTSYENPGIELGLPPSISQGDRFCFACYEFINSAPLSEVEMQKVKSDIEDTLNKGGFYKTEPKDYLRQEDYNDLAQQMTDVVSRDIENDMAMKRDAEQDMWWVIITFGVCVIILGGIFVAACFVIYNWIFTF